MNMDFAIQQVALDAHKYAIQGGQIEHGTKEYSTRYNGYHAGAITRLAEIEGLRGVIKVLEQRLKTDTKEIKTDTDKTLGTLDSLI